MRQTLNYIIHYKHNCQGVLPNSEQKLDGSLKHAPHFFILNFFFFIVFNMVADAPPCSKGNVKFCGKFNISKMCGAAPAALN